MSFILDALKKSENERQQNVPAEFSHIRMSQDSPGPPRWLWVLGGLLAINIALVGYTLTTKSRQATPAEPPPSAAAVDEKSTGVESLAFSERVELARQQKPVRSGTPADTVEPAAKSIQNEVLPVARRPAAKIAPQHANFALLPSLAELRANGTSQLPDLHLDIHVFSGETAQRFVFINMNKYRENDQITEGPSIREITRDGVILEHLGKSFVLLRE